MEHDKARKKNISREVARIYGASLERERSANGVESHIVVRATTVESRYMS